MPAVDKYTALELIEALEAGRVQVTYDPEFGPLWTYKVVSGGTSFTLVSHSADSLCVGLTQAGMNLDGTFEDRSV